MTFTGDDKYANYSHLHSLNQANFAREFFVDLYAFLTGGDYGMIDDRYHFFFDYKNKKQQ
jgi:hypothetical protein